MMECLDCGEFFDLRNFKQVIFHAFGHNERTEYGAVTKIRVCADCDATMHFIRRRWTGYVGFWKCDNCNRVEWTEHLPKIWKPTEIRFS